MLTTLNEPPAMDNSEEDKRAIMTLIRVLDEVRRVRPDIPASHLHSLLTVALEEGKGVREYAVDADKPHSTMTRHLLDMGGITRRREPGLGLLIQKTNPMDMRQHQTFLSPTGRTLINKLVRTVKFGR